MPEYRVSIDVEARTPREAARFALEMLQDPDDYPTIFHVVRLHCMGSGIYVDLMKPEPENPRETKGDLDFHNDREEEQV